jgi:hypothetical protein
LGRKNRGSPERGGAGVDPGGRMGRKPGYCYQKSCYLCRLQEAIGHAADTAMRGVPARRIDPEIRPHNIRLAVPLAFAAHSGIKLHTRLVDIERGPLIPSIPPIPSIPSIPPIPSIPSIPPIPSIPSIPPIPSIPSIPSIPPIPPIPPIPSVRLFPVQFRESGQRTGSLPYKQRLYHSTRPHRKPTHAQGARSEVTVPGMGAKCGHEAPVRGLEGAGVPVSGKRGCLRRAPRPRSRTLRPTKGASSSTFAATSTVASLDLCQPRPLPGLLPPPAARRHTAPIRMAPAPPSSHPGYAPMPLARTGKGCGGYWGTCGAYARRRCCGLLHVGSMMRSRHARGLAALSRMRRTRLSACRNASHLST